jgi:hypothetical protein
MRRRLRTGEQNEKYNSADVRAVDGTIGAMAFGKDEPIKLSTVTDMSTPSYPDVMRLFRQKIGSHETYSSEPFFGRSKAHAQPKSLFPRRVRPHLLCLQDMGKS